MAAQERSARGGLLLGPRVSLFGDYQWYNEQDYAFGPDPENTGNVSQQLFPGRFRDLGPVGRGTVLGQANEAQEKANEAIDDFNSAKLRPPMTSIIGSGALSRKSPFTRPS